VEAVSEYIKRLRRLEEIAFEFPAVNHAYALQAGRELRVAVLPDMIDDAGAVNLARDLTHAIQQRIRYSGKIKITIVREKRVVNYAL
jgi:ribonuclease Y